jgi:hypothetical protein
VTASGTDPLAGGGPESLSGSDPNWRPSRRRHARAWGLCLQYGRTVAEQRELLEMLGFAEYRRPATDGLGTRRNQRSRRA